MCNTSRYLLLLLFQAASLSDAAIGDVLWRDDFDGTSLNTNFWSYDLGGGGWGNSELQTYTQSAVSVSSGLLNIRAERVSTSFTSGRIKTDGKVTFQYGTVEARIKIPDVNEGLWPAFWTLGSNFDDVGWPRSGEIDIMEIGQGLAITEGVVNRRVISGAHWENNNQLAAYALWKTFNVDLNDDFHIYRLEWTPTSLSTYVDGIQVWVMDLINCLDCEEFQQPHFLLLNLAVGGFFTSTGGSGSSGGSSGSSSSANCTSSSSSAGSSSAGSSSGGCGVAREDVSAPLPADMLVDWVQIIDNGFAIVTPTYAPTSNPTPGMSRVGQLSTKNPTKRPTVPPTQRASTKRPSPRPTSRPTPNPTKRPTPRPTVFPTSNGVLMLSTKNPTRRPTQNPTPQPTVGWGYLPEGKGGKGKGGKSGSKGSKYYYNSASSKGKSGKGGKSGSKKSSKGSKRSAQYTTISSNLNAANSSTTDLTVSQQAKLITVLLSLSMLFAS